MEPDRVLRHHCSRGEKQQLERREGLQALYAAYNQMRERLDLVYGEVERFHRRIDRLARRISKEGERR